MPLTTVLSSQHWGKDLNCLMAQKLCKRWASESEEVPILKALWLGGGQWEADKEIVQLTLEQAIWGPRGLRKGLGNTYPEV